MKCPDCDTPRMRTLDTRVSIKADQADIAAFAKDWPDVVARRRHCMNCKKTVVTVELPWEDLQSMVKWGA